MKWEDYRNGEENRLNKIISEKTIEIKNLENEHDEIVKEEGNIDRLLDANQKASDRFDFLSNQFALNSDGDVLERNLEDLNQKVAEKQTLLSMTKQEKPEYCKNNISRCKGEIERLQKDLERGDKLFKRSIQSLLTSEEMNILYGLLNRRIFSFEIENMGDIQSFAEKFKKWLNSQGETLNINGLLVKRDEIAKDRYKEQSAEEIKEEIEENKNELGQYEAKLRAIEERNQVIDEYNLLVDKRKKAQKELDEYNEFVDLKVSESERKAEKKQVD